MLGVPGTRAGGWKRGPAGGSRAKGQKGQDRHWSTTDRPTLGPLAAVGAMVGTASAIDGLVMVWTAATFLDPQCGEDIAWWGLVAAGIGASLAAFVAVSVVAWWWWRGPPASLRTAARVLATVVAASAVLAGVAVLWLPDGSCP